MTSSLKDLLVSVVVPVFNSEKTLVDCLEALLTQTHRCIEIIAVDDGSIDGSGTILDQYASRDRRLRVLHQANTGVWQARLTAIDLASGQWLAACDSDDLPAERWVEAMLSAAVRERADMVVCAYQRVESLTGRVLAREMTGQADLLQPAHDPVGAAAINSSLCNKLYRTEVVKAALAALGSAIRENPALARPRLMEDMILNAVIVARVGRVGFIDEALYDYLVRPTASMTTLTVTDAQVVADWLLAIRGSLNSTANAAIVDLMAFVHLGVSALDCFVRTARRAEVRDYLRWLRPTLREGFPLYTESARPPLRPTARKLIVARWLYGKGLLPSGLRALALFARLFRREVKW